MLNNGDARVQISLVLVHAPLEPQTIFRGPKIGVCPGLQVSTISAPGL